MGKRVLVVEDDPEISGVVALHLRDHGFRVEQTPSGREALARCRGGGFDLLVLDLKLPDLDGLEVCRSLRASGERCPILMLTARGGEADRVLGLELGADDYLGKPFSVRELVARVKALLRRAQPAPAPQLADAAPFEHHGLRVDPAKRRVTLHGQPVALTATEFDLLHHLARHPGRVYSRAQLLDAVWGYSHAGYEHTVNSHINRLRAKLERDPARPLYVRTVWGVGYKFPDAADWGEG